MSTNKLNGPKNSLNMLDAVTNLKEAGFNQEQAEAVVRMQYALIDSHLATKADIKELELKIENSANKQTIILGGLFITVAGGAVGIIFTLAKVDLLSIS